MGKRVDSPAVRVELRPRERGRVELVIALSALLEAARRLAGERTPWLVVSMLVASALAYAVQRRLWARNAAPCAAHLHIDDGRVVVERDGARQALALVEPREGWATPQGRGEVVALRLASGGLVSFAARDREEATSALEAAGVGLPRRFTLDRAWPRLATRGVLVGFTLATIALLSFSPAAGYAFAAVGLGARAYVVHRRPWATVERGALVIDRRRVDLSRIVSVEETPGGVSLLAADGTETLLPIATRPPIRRADAKPWTSEAELRDAALAQRAALREAVRTACAVRADGRAYRAADGRDVRGAFGVR